MAIDTIWVQAGIDINFLTPNTWNNTFANWGSGGPPDNGGISRPQSDLNMIETLSVGPPSVRNSDPNVINMFFVNIAAGFPLLGANNAAGLVERPGNDITQYVGTNLLNFQDMVGTSSQVSWRMRSATTWIWNMLA